jgi:hypothetical protein
MRKSEKPIPIPMDLYNCESCTNAFAVEKDAPVYCCPVCEDEIFEFSHEIQASQK